MSKRKTTLAPASDNSPEMALLDKAEEHFKKSEYAAAEQLANEVLSHTDGNGTLTPSGEARALYILGTCSAVTARYDDAAKRFRDAYLVAESASDVGLQLRALTGTASIHYHTGNYTSSVSIAEQALALAEQTHNTRESARSLNAIGMAWSALGDYTRALENQNRCLALTQTLGDVQMEAALLTNLAATHSRLGDYHLALATYGRALTRCEKSGDTNSIGIALDGLGGMYAKLSDFPRALDYFTRALALAEETGNKMVKALTLGNIGGTHIELQDYPRAMDYLRRSLELKEEIGDKGGIVIVLGNMGTASMNHGDYAHALEYFRRALVLSLEIGARRPAGFWMEGIANTQLQLGNLDAAYKGFLDALHHRQHVLGSKEMIARTLIHLSEVLIELKRPEEALDRLQEALRVSEEVGTKEYTASAHEAMSAVYASNGDTAQAYEHIIKSNALEKEIHTEQSQKRVDLFNMRVAVSEIEHGVEVQKLRGQQLEHDLANSAIHLASQTELLDRFRTDLSQIFREIDEPIAALKRIREKLKELPCQQIDWTKFEAQFSQVHPEFRTKLAEKYPELTEMEQRIAAMVRMDLKSTDIARLFCITERAVEFHRLNLRKKLVLRKEANLQKFLAGI
jgi:tetratricopeptide (TPR) repeat protein